MLAARRGAGRPHRVVVADRQERDLGRIQLADQPHVAEDAPCRRRSRTRVLVLECGRRNRRALPRYTVVPSSTTLLVWTAGIIRSSDPSISIVPPMPMPMTSCSPFLSNQMRQLEHRDDRRARSRARPRRRRRCDPSGRATADHVGLVDPLHVGRAHRVAVRATDRVTIRLPPGVVMTNVACPNHVIASASHAASIMIEGVEHRSPQFHPRPPEADRGAPRQPKPDWLKVRAPGSENYLRLKGLMRGSGCTPSARKRTARTSASAGTMAPRRS